MIETRIWLALKTHFITACVVREMERLFVILLNIYTFGCIYPIIIG